MFHIEVYLGSEKRTFDNCSYHLTPDFRHLSITHSNIRIEFVGNFTAVIVKQEAYNLSRRNPG